MPRPISAFPIYSHPTTPVTVVQRGCFDGFNRCLANIRASPSTLHPCGIRFDYDNTLEVDHSDGYARPLLSPKSELETTPVPFNQRLVRPTVVAAVLTRAFVGGVCRSISICCSIDARRRSVCRPSCTASTSTRPTTCRSGSFSRGSASIQTLCVAFTIAERFVVCDWETRTGFHCVVPVGHAGS